MICLKIVRANGEGDGGVKLHFYKMRYPRREKLLDLCYFLILTVLECGRKGEVARFRNKCGEFCFFSERFSRKNFSEKFPRGKGAEVSVYVVASNCVFLVDDCAKARR